MLGDPVPTTEPGSPSKVIPGGFKTTEAAFAAAQATGLGIKETIPLTPDNLSGIDFGSDTVISTPPTGNAGIASADAPPPVQAPADEAISPTPSVAPTAQEATPPEEIKTGEPKDESSTEMSITQINETKYREFKELIEKSHILCARVGDVLILPCAVDNGNQQKVMIGFDKNLGPIQIYADSTKAIETIEKIMQHRSTFSPEDLQKLKKRIDDANKGRPPEAQWREDMQAGWLRAWIEDSPRLFAIAPDAENETIDMAIAQASNYSDEQASSKTKIKDDLYKFRAILAKHLKN